MRKKKIESLKKQIAKLERLKFEEQKTYPILLKKDDISYQKEKKQSFTNLLIVI